MKGKIAGEIKPTVPFPRESQLVKRIHLIIDDFRDQGVSQVSVIGILEMIKDDMIRESRQ